ncbi:MAG: hypothetical protein K2M04_08300, partial [Muribaculaceae bacterium]|nr:hypothetical protein [Muribaculaceae bacterium]
PDFSPAAPLTILPDTAQLLPGHPFFVPDFAPDFFARFAPAYRVSKLGKNIAERFAMRYIDAVLPSLRISSPDLPSALSGFDCSLALGTPLPVDDLADRIISLQGNAFSLPQFAISQAVSFLSRYFLLRTGDIIVPGYVDNSDTHLVIDTPIEVTVDGARVMRLKIK